MAKDDETKTKLDPIIEYKDDIDEFVTLVNGCIEALEWISKECNSLHYETHDENCTALGMKTDKLLTKWKKLRHFLTQCEQR